MSALIALVSTTRFSDLLQGLARLGVPRILLTQLGFLYRYIFLLIDRAQHMLRARAGRKVSRMAVRTELHVAAAMIGSLLISSLSTAERVSTAMQARGFEPQTAAFPTLTPMRLRVADLVFCVIAACWLLTLHWMRYHGLHSGPL
jgi:cobalt/nickel transport system permease protein